MNKIMLIAHRGVTETGSHENTLDAYKKAIELNLDGIEIDIHKTKDNLYVCHHDHDIDGKLIKDYNYNQILEFSNKYNYKVPLLKEVLELCKGKIFLDIELKEESYEKEICDFVLSFLNYNEFCFRSFSDKTVRTIKKYNKSIKCGLLLGVKKGKYFLITRLSELFPLVRILYTKCDFVSPHYNLVLLGYIQRMHLIRKPVIVWTVNTETIMKKLIKNNVDGIITDKISILINIVQKR